MGLATQGIAVLQAIARGDFVLVLFVRLVQTILNVQSIWHMVQDIGVVMKMEMHPRESVKIVVLLQMIVLVKVIIVVEMVSVIAIALQIHNVQLIIFVLVIVARREVVVEGAHKVVIVMQ